MTRDDLQTFSSSWDPIWEEIFKSKAWGKYPAEYVVRFIAKNFYQTKQRDSVKLLDLGCGPGACTWFMAREGFSVFGIDGSHTSIAQAKERLSKEGLSADLIVGDFMQLPYPDNFFDGCLDNAALCCNRFARCRHIVSEVKRVLKPGGRFLSANFSPATWGFGRGLMLETNGFSDITEGPLKDRGFALFFDRDQIDQLYNIFELIFVEQTSWTLQGMERLVELWLVEVQK